MVKKGGKTAQALEIQRFALFLFIHIFIVEISLFLDDSALNHDYGVVHGEYSSNYNSYGSLLAKIGQNTKYEYTGCVCAAYYHAVGGYDY